MRHPVVTGLIATAIAFGAAAGPALAQGYQGGSGYQGGGYPPPAGYARNDAVERRWQAAQARYRAETDRFRAEQDAYARARGGAGYGYNQQGGYNGGYNGGYAQPGGYGQQGDYARAGYDDDRDEGDYDASRYYRGGASYQERTLAADDRVYAGSDGRYYCKRSDGTTGLIVGAASGGILGNVIDGGHSRTAGTLIGGAIGALVGRSVDQQQSASIRCR